MSSAYLARVTDKKGDTLTIDVLQMHPDYGLEPDEFLETWGAMAVAGWAFPDGYARTNCGCSNPKANSERVVANGASTPLGTAMKSFDNMFDTPVTKLPKGVKVTSELVREAYNDNNRKERMTAAGIPANAPLTAEVVAKICGQLRLTVKSTDAELFKALPVNAEWEF